MKNIILRIQAYREKKRYDIILHDRSHLTDYEKEQLIPELKLRLNVLKQYFNEIIKLCDLQRDSQEFNQNLSSIINPAGLADSPNSSSQSISEKFFSDVKMQSQKEGIDDIDKILNSYSDIQNTKQLGLFMNEVNLLCSSLIAVKNKLFLYKIEGYPFVTNIRTGQTIAAQPQQYFLTTEPFQITIHNIIGVATATSETIHEWHKYAMKLKSQYLDLYTSRLSIKNAKWAFRINLATIFIAIFLSAFFLVANDPFKLFKENTELKSKITTLENDISKLKVNLMALRDASPTKSTQK